MGITTLFAIDSNVSTVSWERFKRKCLDFTSNDEIEVLVNAKHSAKSHLIKVLGIMSTLIN